MTRGTQAVVVALAVALCIAGCSSKPQQQSKIESRIRALVKRGASADQVFAELGEPYHVYTREEALGYLAKTPERDVAVRDTWRQFSRYRETIWYRGQPTFDNYIFLDAKRKAVDCLFKEE